MTELDMSAPFYANQGAAGVTDPPGSADYNSAFRKLRNIRWDESDSRLVVPGASGMIGRRIVAALGDEGHAVRVLLWSTSSGQALPPDAETICGDTR
jgi:hypothetical protein